jgi:hypothetical protein
MTMMMTQKAIVVKILSERENYERISSQCQFNKICDVL